MTFSAYGGGGNSAAAAVALLACVQVPPATLPPRPRIRSMKRKKLQKLPKTSLQCLKVRNALPGNDIIFNVFSWSIFSCSYCKRALLQVTHKRRGLRWSVPERVRSGSTAGSAGMCSPCRVGENPTWAIMRRTVIYFQARLDKALITQIFDLIICNRCKYNFRALWEPWSHDFRFKRGFDNCSLVFFPRSKVLLFWETWKQRIKNQPGPTLTFSTLWKA